MKNDEGEVVDLYIPRKCAWTDKLITAKDHASVQLNIGHLNEEGIYQNHFTTFALAGKVRAQGEADSALDVMWRKKVTDGQAA
jgi:small subunit ribosomal protein S21e